MVASSETTDRVAGAQQEAGPSISKLGEDLRIAFAEFGEYTKYLIALEVDRATLMAKKAGFFAGVGVIGLAVVMAALATGTGLLLIGIAGLIGHALGSFWLGATIVGLLMLILLAAGAWIGWSLLTKRAMKAMRLKYADRRQRQKKMYGRDIKEVANA